MPVNLTRSTRPPATPWPRSRSFATAGIAGALRGAQDVTLTDHLRAALTSREVIDQAIGIIIGQQHCTPERAFAALRAISLTRNVRLHDVAAELVRGSVRPDSTSPGD